MMIDDDDPTQEEIDTNLEDAPTSEELAPKEKEKSKSNTGNTSSSLPLVPNILPFPQKNQKKHPRASFGSKSRERCCAS